MPACEICDDDEAYALLYFHPQLGSFSPDDPLPEEDAQLQLSCQPCAQDVLDRGIAREYPLPNPRADATSHADIIKTYLARGDDQWIGSEDYEDLFDNR